MKNKLLSWAQFFKNIFINFYQKVILPLGIILKKYFIKLSKGALIPTLVSILIGLLVGLILMLAIGKDIGSSFEGFFVLITQGFENFSNVLFYAGPLVLLGLSVAVGFKTGLFNIGTPGQYTAGGVTALYLAILFPPIPVLHIIVCLVGAILAGAIVGLIPGLLKAFFNISEVITSIMLNYITTYGAIIFVNNPKVRDIQSAMIKINFSSTAKLYSFGIGKLDIGIIIAIISIIIVSIVLFKTKFGYKLRAVGLNKDASKYAGMNTKLLTILAMVIAGGLAGLAAVLSFLPKTPSAMMRAENTVRAIGFDGIFIALIGGSDPFGVGLSALFISFLREGSTSVQLYGFSKEAVDVIIGVIIYLVAIQSFIRVFINKWPNFFKKLFKKKGKEVINE